MGYAQTGASDRSAGYRFAGLRGCGRRLVSGTQSGSPATRRSLEERVTVNNDLLGQAFSAMRHDLRKTVLTMLGMAWGIATVVLLLAYGDGFARAIDNIFESFGATAVGIFPNRTSEQAGGTKAGVQVRFTNDDVELLRNVVPLVRHLSRQSQKPSVVQHGARSYHFHVLGLDPPIYDIWNLQMAEGRF